MRSLLWQDRFSMLFNFTQVLRKYSDKTMARDLVRELEAFEGDPSNIMISRAYSTCSQPTHSGVLTSVSARISVALPGLQLLL